LEPHLDKLRSDTLGWWVTTFTDWWERLMACCTWRHFIWPWKILLWSNDALNITNQDRSQSSHRRCSRQQKLWRSRLSSDEFVERRLARRADSKSRSWYTSWNVQTHDKRKRPGYLTERFTQNWCMVPSSVHEASRVRH